MTTHRFGAALLACAITAGVSGAKLEPLTAQRGGSNSLLYLPNGKYLKLASLGQAALLADLVYLWAIQYYSNYEREDRHRYIEHVFGTVIAELDPHYIDAYWMGALILTLEARDLEGGLRLLEQGFEKNPQQWVLPYLAGWECSFANQHERAVAYFRQAAAVPGAPPKVLRTIAGMYDRSGDRKSALANWVAIAEDPDGDPASVAIAERQIRSLTVELHLQQLNVAIAAFRDRNARWPKSLAELASAGYVSHVPMDPDGQSYVYDSADGSVSSAAGRLLVF